MANSYDIRLADAFGVELAVLNDFISCDYVRSVNNLGTLNIIVPPTYNLDLFKIDGHLSVYRSINGASPYLDGQTIWLIRNIRKTLNLEGEYLYHIQAFDTIDILRRRIVAYASGSSQTSKTDFADDMMKEIMSQNFGAGATDAARNISTYLSIQADLSAAQSLSKSFARRQILPLFQELAQASTLAGTYLAFDIVAPTPTTLEFRTYTGQRGIDHRFPNGSPPVLIGPEYGNLVNPDRTYDYTEEATYVYAGGQGEEANRLIATASDPARIGASPLNRIEYFRDARQVSTAAALADEADAFLREKRPRKTFTGEFVDTPGTTYGLHFGYGDFVTTTFDGELLDCRVDAVRISLANGQEKIGIKFRSDD